MDYFLFVSYCLGKKLQKIYIIISFSLIHPINCKINVGVVDEEGANVAVLIFCSPYLLPFITLQQFYDSRGSMLKVDLLLALLFLSVVIISFYIYISLQQKDKNDNKAKKNIGNKIMLVSHYLTLKTVFIRPQQL